MENHIKDMSLQLEELRSCVVILQKALQNENDEVFLKDIDNYLEIILGKIDLIIKNTNLMLNEILS